MLAFEITKEDVKISLELNYPDVESGDDTVSGLYDKLDFDAIEKSVMYETDFDKQIEAAFEEIAQQISKRLTGRSGSEPTNKPLTTEELMEAGWWCADVSADCAVAFKSKGLRVSNSTEWGDDEVWKGCSMNAIGDATRGRFDFIGKNQIHRDGNEFYWSEE